MDEICRSCEGTGKWDEEVICSDCDGRGHRYLDLEAFVANDEDK